METKRYLVSIYFNKYVHIATTCVTETPEEAVKQAMEKLSSICTGSKIDRIEIRDTDDSMLMP